MKLSIIDDHPIVRAGIAAVLESSLSDMEKMIEAGNCVEFIEQNYQSTFDLILLDYHIPESNPKDNFEMLNTAFPQARIVFLSSDENPRIISQCLQQGASGFVVKSSNMELLVATIKFVLAGGTYLPTLVLGEFGNTQTDDSAYGDLTPRQLDVFKMLLAGHSNKKIASMLNISESTVKSHLMAAFKQLSVTSRIEAIKRFND